MYIRACTYIHTCVYLRAGAHGPTTDRRAGRPAGSPRLGAGRVWARAKRRRECLCLCCGHSLVAAPMIEGHSRVRAHDRSAVRAGARRARTHTRAAGARPLGARLGAGPAAGPAPRSGPAAQECTSASLPPRPPVSRRAPVPGPTLNQNIPLEQHYHQESGRENVHLHARKMVPPPAAGSHSTGWLHL